jgi:hypothetical protein
VGSDPRVERQNQLLRAFQVETRNIAIVPERLTASSACLACGWYPEDMALRLDAFLDDLNEEAIGRRNGLESWLRLKEAGFMNSGLPGAAVARWALIEELRSCGGPKIRA